VGAAAVKALAVIAPKREDEARAAVGAIRALLTQSSSSVVTVFAEGGSLELLREAGVETKSMEDGVSGALLSSNSEGVILMDPHPQDAVDARAAGVGVRVGWGTELGALTHALRPAQLGGRPFRPSHERTYFDLVGLCGVLQTEALAAPAQELPEGRVLIRLPNWLGDIVQCEPLLRTFTHSAERLTLVGPPIAEELLGATLSGARWLEAEVGARSWRDHDLALLLDGSLRSAWRAARARIPRRVSWGRGGKSLLLTEAVSPPLELGLPALARGVVGSHPRWLPRPFDGSVAELGSAAGIGVSEGPPRLSVSLEAQAAAAEQLEGLGIGAREVFVLASVGGREGSAKAVPRSTWAALLEALRAARELPVLLTSAPGEERQLDELEQLGLPSGVSIAGATQLGALCGLMERASAFLTADSGPRHLAAALGCPSVVLHGPTDPRHSGCVGAPIRVSRLEVPCGPCHLERCPLSGSEHLACFGLRHVGSAVAMLCELLAADTPA